MKTNKNLTGIVAGIALISGACNNDTDNRITYAVPKECEKIIRVINYEKALDLKSFHLECQGKEGSLLWYGLNPNTGTWTPELNLVLYNKGG